MPRALRPRHPQWVGIVKGVHGLTGFLPFRERSLMGIEEHQHPIAHNRVRLLCVSRLEEHGM
jgi:hypothetical protein